MDGFRKLIGELHRRSIWQVLAIYLAGSWIALQVVETLAETLDLPEWAPGLAFTLLVVGLPIVLATAFVQEGRGFGNRRLGNEFRSQAAGDSLLVLMESLSVPSPGWREALVSVALLSKGRNEEAQAVARDCLDSVDPERDGLDEVTAATLCLQQLGAAGAPDEAIDGLIRIADRPNRDLSSGRLAHVPAYRDVLGDHPRFPEFQAKLQEVERAAQGH